MHTQLSELLRWGEYVPLEPCSKSLLRKNLFLSAKLAPTRLQVGPPRGKKSEEKHI